MDNTISRAAVLAAIEAMPPNIYDLGDKYVRVDHALAAINALPASDVAEKAQDLLDALQNDGEHSYQYGGTDCGICLCAAALEAALPSAPSGKE